MKFRPVETILGLYEMWTGRSLILGKMLVSADDVTPFRPGLSSHLFAPAEVVSRHLPPSEAVKNRVLPPLQVLAGEEYRSQVLGGRRLILQFISSYWETSSRVTIESWVDFRLS